MSDDKKTPWHRPFIQQLEQTAAAANTEAVFEMTWDRPGTTRRVTVQALDGILQAHVTDDMVAELAAIDEQAFVAQLQDAGQRTAWSNARALILQSAGLPLSLSRVARGYWVPLEAPTWKTVAVGVYSMLFTNADDVLRFLPAPMQETGRQALKTGILKPRCSIKELYAAVFDASDEAPDETGAADVPDDEELSPWQTHRNVIFFGPPGTGKSFRLKQLAKEYLDARERLRRVTFHPEYGYQDFVGSVEPRVGWLSSRESFTDVDGAQRSAEPRVYYGFEPGPLARSIAEAINHPGKHWVLVIEEINRGNCAAIFGDIFQLLDRGGDRTRPETFGQSEYAIHVSSAFRSWLDAHITVQSENWHDGRLRLPRNLFLWATMNTSDQGLFPMDTAFKRRWAMDYMSVQAPEKLATRVPLHSKDDVGILWRDLLQDLNAAIVSHTRTDDKQMGPWFVQPLHGQTMVSELQVRSKVLFYLWNDVFRDEPSRIFQPSIRTYDQLVACWRAGKSVFNADSLPTLSAADANARDAAHATDA